MEMIRKHGTAPPSALRPGNKPVSTEHETGWATEVLCGDDKHFSTLPRFEHRIVQPVTQSLYRPHYADSFRVVVNLLRRIFGPKRDEVTGKQRRLHNKELYALYATPNNIREMKSRMRWARHVARMGDTRGAEKA
jgi:hypothetical protein